MPTNTKTLFVIMSNDYPTCVMSENTTEAQAEAYAKSLFEENKRAGNLSPITTPVIYYRACAVPVVETPPDPVPETMSQHKFDVALHNWLKGAQAIVDQFHKGNGSSTSDRLTLEPKGKVILVVMTHERGGRSAWAFIAKQDYETKGLGKVRKGDVLKPASWLAPAKHARGNIFDEKNGTGNLLWTGPAYLR